MATSPDDTTTSVLRWPRGVARPFPAGSPAHAATDRSPADISPERCDGRGKAAKTKEGEGGQPRGASPAALRRLVEGGACGDDTDEIDTLIVLRPPLAGRGDWSENRVEWSVGRGEAGSSRGAEPSPAREMAGVGDGGGPVTVELPAEGRGRRAEVGRNGHEMPTVELASPARGGPGATTVLHAMPCREVATLLLPPREQRQPDTVELTPGVPWRWSPREGWAADAAETDGLIRPVQAGGGVGSPLRVLRPAHALALGGILMILYLVW